MNLPRVWVGGILAEEMHERIGAGVDGDACAVECADVHDREFLARVRGCDQLAQIVFRQRRELETEGRAVLVDELDVVRNLRRCVRR